MSAPAVLTLLWLVAANVLAWVPSRGNRRRRAAALVVLGVPLLGWLTAGHGPVAGVLALAAGAVVLRWPLVRPRAPRRRAEPAE